MAMKINPPDLAGKSYEQFKIELTAWQTVTSVDKKKQGIAIALSLPENDSTLIRRSVFEELSIDDLGSDDGLTKLITFLDSKLGKDDLADSLEKCEAFDDFVRSDDQSVADFITKFDQKYNRIVKKGMTLPSEILAFQLLKRARITSEEKMLVLTGMDYAKNKELYAQAKKSLKKFKGTEPCDGGGSRIGGAACSKPAVKLEPAFIAENEEAFLAAGYRVTPVRGNWRGRYEPRRGHGTNSRGSAAHGSETRFHQERNLNPTGRDGKTLTCHYCGSYRHLLRDCPDSWESRGKQASKRDENEVFETAVLFTGYDKSETARLGIESRYCAVLDSACSSTVCGEKWLKCYIDHLR